VKEQTEKNILINSEMHFLLSALHYIHKKPNIFDVCVTLIKLEYTLCFGFISHACFLCFSNRHVFVLSHILQSSIVYSTLHASTHNTRSFCTHTHTAQTALKSGNIQELSKGFAHAPVREFVYTSPVQPPVLELKRL